LYTEEKGQARGAAKNIEKRRVPSLHQTSELGEDKFTVRCGVRQGGRSTSENVKRGTCHIEGLDLLLEKEERKHRLARKESKRNITMGGKKGGGSSLPSHVTAAEGGMGDGGGGGGT